MGLGNIKDVFFKIYFTIAVGLKKLLISFIKNELQGFKSMDSADASVFQTHLAKAILFLILYFLVKVNVQVISSHQITYILDPFSRDSLRSGRHTTDQTQELLEIEQEN